MDGAVALLATRVQDGESDAATSVADAVDGDLVSHLIECPNCRDEFDTIVRVDEALAGGLSLLKEQAERSMERGVAATLAELRREPFAARMMRRARRHLRMVMWVAFFALTFTACCVLAVALYRAIISG